jgi:hypothetical protein
MYEYQFIMIISSFAFHRLRQCCTLLVILAFFATGTIQLYSQQNHIDLQKEFNSKIVSHQAVALLKLHGKERIKGLSSAGAAKAAPSHLNLLINVEDHSFCYRYILSFSDLHRYARFSRSTFSWLIVFYAHLFLKEPAYRFKLFISQENSMSPIGAVILSILLITGIMLAGNSYESAGISENGWIGVNIVLLAALIIYEIRHKITSHKTDENKDSTQGE